MNPDITLFLGHYHRFLHVDENLLIIVGDMGTFPQSKRQYEQAHNIPTNMPGHSDPALMQLIGACALAGAALSERESWGWTLALPDLPYAYFIGLEPDGMICANVSKRTRTDATVFVQRQKPGEGQTQSHYVPSSNKAETVVQDYADQVLQLDTRIAIDDTGSGVLVQSLPGGNMTPVHELTRNDFLHQYGKTSASTHIKSMGEFLTFYECRCDDSMIRKMVDALSPHQQTDLFQTEKTIDIECPRCGRQYRLSKT